MRRLLSLGAVLATGLLLGTQLGAHPQPEPMWGIPPASVEAGQDAWLSTRDVLFLPGYAERWLQAFPPDPKGPLVVDRRHSDNQPNDSDISLWTHSYGAMHGYARAFRLVERGGVDVREQWAVITPGALSGAAGLFINLVSGDNPAFEQSEVEAIEAFVRHGGGLVLITEHTNAYLHADMLHGLQRAFGFELPPVTNADRKRRNILGPTTVAWVRIRPLVQHPLTEGVAVAGITTGGVVQGSGWTGVMGGSEHSWMDWGDPGSDSSGFAGNLQREPDEPLGPHAVVAVKEHGEGRVVVLADQNAFGATHIGYEDNERLWSNAVAWALDRPMPLPADNPVTTLTGRRSLCTSAAAFGFHTLQVQSSRLSAWSGTPNRCTAGPDMGDRVLMLPEYAGELPQPARGLALVEPGRLASLRILEPLGLTWSPPGEPSTGAVQWSEPMPAPAGLGLEGTVTAAPLGLTGDFEVVATDAAGRPLVVRSGAWLLLLDAAVLSNAQMGKERASRDEAPGPYDLAFRLLGWLFE